MEELVEGKDSDVTQMVRPINNKIKFSYSDSEEDENHGDEKNVDDHIVVASDKSNDTTPNNCEVVSSEKNENREDSTVAHENHEDGKSEDGRQLEKKPRIEKDESKREQVIKSNVEEKSVDKLIEAELEELKDKSKVSIYNIEERGGPLQFDLCTYK